MIHPFVSFLHLVYVIISSNLKWSSVGLSETVFRYLKYTFWKGVTWGKEDN